MIILEPVNLSSRGIRAHTHLRAAALLPYALVLTGLLTACQPTEEQPIVPEPIRPVRVVTVEKLPGGETVTLTGNIQAQDDV
ncbi:MAG TPA: efflux transporter periplasmic adaptor subunit, partial [Lamprocystis sp. (in: g-proteobacteria)]|nr:efflux transporter periplasmic adaptor subunit [Lamprocystis sp. (in: g-proteobacteria)]